MDNVGEEVHVSDDVSVRLGDDTFDALAVTSDDGDSVIVGVADTECDTEGVVVSVKLTDGVGGSELLIV